MKEAVCRILFSKTYKRMVSNKEKTIAYKSNLGTWETRLNDQSRMIMNSIRGSVDAEKFINKSGVINVSGFMNYVKQQYPNFYNSRIFQDYNRQVIYLQGKIRFEKEIINRFIRFFNQDVQNHPSLSKIWNFELLPYDVWNEGRDIENVSKEYNDLNNEKF